MGYQLIETVTVGSGGAASIEFTGIADNLGQALKLVWSARATGDSGPRSYAQVNGDTASNYSTINLSGSGSAASSSTSQNLTYFQLFDAAPGTGATADTFGNAEMNFSNYSSSTAKSMSYDAVTENNGTSAFQNLAAGKWSGTAAISSIKLYLQGGSFAQYSTASLYSIS
jgi:hypothetical protein